MEGKDQKSRKFRCRISIRLFKRILSDQEEEVSQVLNSVGEDLVPAVVKKPKLATTSSIDSSVLYPSLLALITVQMSKLNFRSDSMLYSVLYSFYLQIIKKLSERFSTFPRSTISVPGGIITVSGGFILRFINLLFCSLIGQFVLCMVEYYMIYNILYYIIMMRPHVYLHLKMSYVLSIIPPVPLV